MKHLIDIAALSKETLLNLLRSAQNMLDTPPSAELLTHKIIANLFFEPSTRTSCSFEIAAQKLGAYTLNLDIERSSTVKGETEVDTVMNLAAMGVHGFIIRHKHNGMVRSLAQELGAQYVVINAGCGTMEHPTQALLDMLTIQQHYQDFSELTVAIIGDLRHSRVAHSDIAALLTLGVKQIRLIGPADFMPHLENNSRIQITDDIKTGLKDADVIITLRVQKERIDKSIIFDPQHFFEHYGLTQTRLHYAKPLAIVMHPGPINRGVEIEDAVANGSQSVILKQVHNGVAVRMAILQHLFTNKE